MSRRRLRAELAVPTTRMEEVRHPSHVWVDPDNANLSLHELVREYTVHLTGRSQPVSSETVDKYRKAIQMYVRSIERQQQLLVLASVTPATANAWIQEQRDAGKIEDGIASRLGAVKVFTNKFIYKHAELTTRDLLAKVPRITPPEKGGVGALASHGVVDDRVTLRVDLHAHVLGVSGDDLARRGRGNSQECDESRSEEEKQAEAWGHVRCIGSEPPLAEPPNGSLRVTRNGSLERGMPRRAARFLHFGYAS